MTDVVDSETRSRMMSGIKGKDTKPEVIIRKKLHALGFRFRLHSKELPGKPDIVLKKYRAIILVNGCFWHGHDCHLYRLPKSNTEFWKKKIESNIKRDEQNMKLYKELGWRVLVIWECTLKGRTRRDHDKVMQTISKWLLSGGEYLELRGRENGN